MKENLQYLLKLFEQWLLSASFQPKKVIEFALSTVDMEKMRKDFMQTAFIFT